MQPFDTTAAGKQSWRPLVPGPGNGPRELALMGCKRTSSNAAGAQRVVIKPQLSTGDRKGSIHAPEILQGGRMSPAWAAPQTSLGPQTHHTAAKEQTLPLSLSLFWLRHQSHPGPTVVPGSVPSPPGLYRGSSGIKEDFRSCGRPKVSFHDES